MRAPHFWAAAFGMLILTIALSPRCRPPLMKANCAELTAVAFAFCVSGRRAVCRLNSAAMGQLTRNFRLNKGRPASPVRRGVTAASLSPSHGGARSGAGVSESLNLIRRNGRSKL